RRPGRHRPPAGAPQRGAISEPVNSRSQDFCRLLLIALLPVRWWLIRREKGAGDPPQGQALLCVCGVAYGRAASTLVAPFRSPLCRLLPCLLPRPVYLLGKVQYPGLLQHALLGDRPLAGLGRGRQSFALVGRVQRAGLGVPAPGTGLAP